MPVITESHNTVQKTGAYKIAPTKPAVDYVAMAVIAATIFLCAYIWPRLRPHVSALIYGGFLTWALFRVVPIIAKGFRPFNYHSITISETGFEYDDRHRVYAVSWQEITKIKFLRYMEWYQDRAWVVTTASGQVVCVLDEFAHRRKLLRAFRKHLSGFTVREARRGFRSWKEGSWICFERASAG